MGINGDEALMKTVIKEMNTNKDNMITFKEFTKYFTKLIKN